MKKFFRLSEVETKAATATAWTAVALFFIAIGICIFWAYSANASTYGSNFLTGGTPTASSYYATQYPSFAFDGNTATFWIASNNYPNSPFYDFPRWLKYDLGAGVAKKINKIAYLNGYNATKPDIQGSNDDINWTTVSSTILTYTDNATWEYRELPYTTSTYRYIRLYYPDSSSATAPEVGTNVAELQAFECTDCDAPQPDTSIAYTEVCYETATSTSCYRPLDVYKSYGIDGLFILVPLFAFAYFLKNRRKNTIQL